ncbi:MAG: response regulator [Rhizobiales bacterium]|nr:response regulator [Hyphomicrobiales bacterium]
MSNDLVSVRMMIVSQPSPDRDIWRQAAGLASVLVEATKAETTAEASQMLARAGIDVVLIDADFPEPHRSAVARAARSARSARSRPVIVLSAASDADVFGVDGDGVVTKPSNLAEAQYLIDRMLRARIPNRVLIVDDSSTMRGIVRKILLATRFPLEVAEAEEGGAALARLREGSFDIIFLDYNMPGLNGLDALAEIRRDHPRLEVVMITSSEDEAIASRVRAAGAAAFLKKPFFPADIDAVLYAFCGLRAIPMR